MCTCSIFLHLTFTSTSMPGICFPLTLFSPVPSANHFIFQNLRIILLFFTSRLFLASPQRGDTILCFSLSDLFHLTVTSRSVHFYSRRDYFILFNTWVVFHWVYNPSFLYSVTCCWSFSLFPLLDCCKLWYYEHKNA